ncbi:MULTISPECIES: transposase [unclassified Nonomuraea]|uniref:transposase n=1 Tax=unclassified Nonomuraea TaxID=2593643 RepID=UPI003402F3FB
MTALGSADLRPKPTRRQVAAGVLGLDLGVTHLVALSQPADLGHGSAQLVNNPRHLAAAQNRLRRAQRALSRTQKGSARREKAKKRLSRLHEQLAVRRAVALHQVTKRLATGFGTVAVEDLHVAGMTRSARHRRITRTQRVAKGRAQPRHSRHQPRRTAAAAHLQDFLVRIHPGGPRAMVSVQQDLFGPACTGRSVSGGARDGRLRAGACTTRRRCRRAFTYQAPPVGRRR